MKLLLQLQQAYDILLLLLVIFVGRLPLLTAEFLMSSLWVIFSTPDSILAPTVLSEDPVAKEKFESNICKSLVSSLCLL